MKRTVAIIKCRPLNVDAWSIAEKYKKAFIGYPAYRKVDAQLSNVIINNKTGFYSLLVDILREDWRSLIADGHDYIKQISFNSNFVKQIDKGSFILVPRPKDGKCYIGLVSGPFELVDRPEWAEEYRELLKEHGKNFEYEEVGSIVQVFPVEEWRHIPFTLVPAWIRYRLLSRNTAGIINNDL